MSDLTDETLSECLNSSWPYGKMAKELLAHRAAIAADKERVRTVVKETVIATLPGHGGWCYGSTHPDTAAAADRIATRAAEQLATPVPPSESDHAALTWLRGLMGSIAYRVEPMRPAALALLDRLLAGTSGPTLTDDEVRQLQHHILDYRATSAYSCSVIERLIAAHRRTP